MKVSIIMPVYNEEATLLTILQKVQKAPLDGIDEREIIVVNDGSSDKSADLLNSIKNSSIKVLHHNKNRGKGAAIRTGFSQVTGDIILIQDSDLEYDPEEYSKLLKPILDNKADVVFGSRFVGDAPHRVLYYWHYLVNKFLTFVSNLFSDLNLTDMEVGYKVFRRNVITELQIEENRFGFEPEITAKVGQLAREKKIRVYEVGISYSGRTYDEGKKITSKDALRALWCIFYYNTSLTARISKYVLMGGVVALSQLISIFLFVEYFGYIAQEQQAFANIVSILISLVVAFFLHAFITWSYKFYNKSDIFKRVVLFYIISGISLWVRIQLYEYFYLLGFNYFVNTLFGILAAIIINFLGYDNIVFVKKSKSK